MMVRPGFHGDGRGPEADIPPFIRCTQTAPEIWGSREDHQMAGFFDLQVVRILFTQEAVALQQKALIVVEAQPRWWSGLGSDRGNGRGFLRFAKEEAQKILMMDRIGLLE